MKRIRMLCFVLVVSMVSLTGCMDVKDISEEKTNLVAEYAAGVLLRYSDRYERRLITKDQVKEEAEASASPGTTEQPSATPEATEASTGESSSQSESDEAEPTEVPEMSINDLYHLSGVEVSYDSYKFTKKYGGQIRAESGETLLVATFALKNTSGKKKKVSLMNRGDIVYTLNVDGSEYMPQICILANGGMNYFEDTIGKGKTEKAVLIFRMEKAKASASSISLSIQEGNQKTNVILKKEET